tara:strand:- start:162 stop:674 length:513 start_codon:yes stop_codon:yes gene_type:complete
MKKRTQLNIEINEELLKSLKFLALSKNIKLNALVKQILSERTKLDISPQSSSCYSEKDAINFHNFMKALFEKKSQQLKYSTKEDAFKSLIPFIEIFDQWGSSNTLRLKSILLESGNSLNPEELNKLCSQEEYEGPIYSGLRNWVGSSEFPSKKLILDLGSSLIPIIENNI